MLQLIDVKKIYTTKAGDTAALDGLSLVLPDTGMIFVTGRSGSGKTTLLNVVGGLDGFDSGDIIIDGKHFNQFTAQDDSSYRNTFVGFIFQEYNLLPDYTIEKNIRIANELQGKETSAEEIASVLQLVGLEGFEQRKPSQMSGGQKQRVAIARALIKEPRIIMADEPTGALDQATGIQVMDTLKKLSKTKLVVVVSHDMEMAERYADRIVRLVDGKLAEDVTLSDESVNVNVYDTKTGLLVKSGADLNEAETATLVKAIREKKKISFADNISGRQKKPTPEIKAVHPETPSEFVSSKMKLKSSMELGVRSLTVKPVRLILTVLLSVIAFALFGLFDTIGAYDNARIVANMLKTSGYNTVTIEGQYVNDIGATSQIRFDDTTINQLNSKTGYNFRGLYEINDAKPSVSNSIGVHNANEYRTIVNTTNATNDPAIYYPGKKYYYEEVTDFIEFKKSEISNRVIDKDGFNLKLLYGEYPTLDKQDGETEFKGEDFANIAISSYLADSLIFWAQNKGVRFIDDEGHELSTEPSRMTPQALVENNVIIAFDTEYYKTLLNNLGKTSGVYTNYRIVGIIDCGEIPAKFNSLKTAETVTPSNKTLCEDLTAYLHSGLYFKVFVAEGYVNAWREFTGKAVRNFGAGRNIDEGVQYRISQNEKDAGKDITGYYTTSFYKAENFSMDNVILFDADRDATARTDNKVTLAKNEVVIPVEEFRNFYSDEIAVNYGNAIVNDSIKIITNTNYDKYSTQERIAALDAIANVFARNNQTVKLSTMQKTIYFKTRTTAVKEATNDSLKIVGIYYCIEDGEFGIAADGFSNKMRPLMLSEAFLSHIGVYTNQGIYSRLVSTNNASYFNANEMAKLMSGLEGLKTPWYKNSILNMIETNRELMKDFSNLFLYLSIVLAVFSIFMLFNYITTSIVSRHQTIGVLRALGSNNRDIFRIFFTESMVITLINGIFASIFAAVGCIFVNIYLQNVMGLSVNFAIFGIRQILIIMALSLITGLLSSLFPILKICKEKPVDLIRRP